MLAPTPLTARQRKIFEYIRSLARVRGRGPTVREIGLQFDFRSTSGVMRHIKALIAKGYIDHDPKKACSYCVSAARKHASEALAIGFPNAAGFAYVTDDSLRHYGVVPGEYVALDCMGNPIAALIKFR